MKKNRLFELDEAVGFVILAAVIFLLFPAILDDFRLNLFGKYLTYAFVAIGLVLCWGAGGILSLGQGVFFGLGGYGMAMFLKLEASTPENTAIQSTPGIPDFMDWNQLTALPVWWEPFHSFGLTLIAIITQAIAAILTILIIGQQGYTGGVNGITDLRTLMGWDIRPDSAKVTLYFVNGVLLFVCLFIAQLVRKSKLGRILIAMRVAEDRVRFSGYDVASFKIFVFCLGAAFAAVGGAMFTLQVGFMSPTLVGIVPSIEMVIFCAVGGRMSILGAVYGALLVNWAKTTFSESFPELWLLGLGGLFIAVVMAFPNGLAGLYDDFVKPRLGLFNRKRGTAAPAAKRAPAE